MPFDKFADIPKLEQERRHAIQQSLETITSAKLNELVKNHPDSFQGNPWREKFLRAVEAHPQGSFYRAVTHEGVVLLFCREEDIGIWILPDSGMGPLPVEGKQHIKEAINLGFIGAKQTVTSRGLRITQTHNQKHNIMNKNLILIATVTLVLATACSRKQAQVAPPPPQVVVATVVRRDVPIVREGVVTLDGFVNADINAQVQGYLTSRDYKEGSLVKKGDLLFQIDPRPFEAQLAQAKGNLARDRAQQLRSDADAKRAMELFQRKVISTEERDQKIATAASNRANVEADEAGVKQAEINLSYTKITSPVDGVAGIASTQVGDLVGPTSAKPLTTVSQVDPIKATVNVGEHSFMEFVTKHSDPDERERYLKSLQFELILGDGTVYPYKGQFYADDRNIDTQTGALRIELTFPNKQHILRPGQFGKMRVAIDTKRGVLVIPSPAVSELQGNQIVATVGADNIVLIRPVKMGERVGRDWEVLEGLTLGERVVVEGQMKLQPGIPVTVKDWVPPKDQVTSVASNQTKEN
jgi:RND family efflux transporter MFP subunit